MPTLGRPIPIRMGQERAIPLDEAGRDSLRYAIADAEQKIPVLDDLIALSDDPNALRQVLGVDTSVFLTLSNQASKDYPYVRDVKARLESDDIEAWFVMPSERDGVDRWIRRVNEMHRLYLAHTEKGEPAPSILRTVQAPVTPSRPGATILGIPTQYVLIGGAAALGVTLLYLATRR